MNILNATQVIKHSISIKELEGRTQPICRVLPQTEQIELKKIIGNDNYKLLIADLVDYSAVEDWNEDTNYVITNLVKFNDIVYELVVAENTSQNYPDCSNEWIEANTFNTACYNRVWIEGGLRTIICWYIYAAAAPFYPQILNVAGFTPNPDSTMKENLGYYLNHVYKEIQKMKTLFFDWYDDDADNQCMKIESCDSSRSIDQNKTHRKVAW